MSLFIGRIPRDTRASELETTFSKFGKFTRFDIKHNQGYGFVEYEDKRDAEDAMKELKGAAFIVEWARGGHRPGGSECFHCGGKGHWARDCSKAPSRDRRDGERGYDRDRRSIRDKDFNRRRDDRGREDRGREDRGRDRSPRRNEQREKGYDRRESDRRRDDDEKDNRRDRRDRNDRDERRREENHAPPRD